MSVATLGARLFDPHIDKFILTTSGEAKVREIDKHWVVLVYPWARVVIGGTVIISVLLYNHWLVFWAGAILGVIVSSQGFWRILLEYRDRFVISNQRVMRVHGNLNQHRASVPLLRILDITVEKPFFGKVFNYGHFVFESAAAVQGLSRITFVKDIDLCEDTLRMVMQGEQTMITRQPYDEDDH